MKIVHKGEKGYIACQRKIEIIKTVVMLALCIATYVIGYVTTGSNKNLLTYVSILGTLPMAKFFVNVVMFFKAKGISDELYERVNATGVSEIYYDLYLTDYKKNYQLSALVFRKGCVIAVSEDSKIFVNDAEAHIKTVLANINVTNVKVKVFQDKEKFIDRLSDLSGDEEKDSRYDEIMENILSVSL